jgi:NAD(P)-dependent dehydrogenase (short-subunit alcohol dehydrogenase family)
VNGGTLRDDGGGGHAETAGHRPTAVVTGASSGIGRQTAIALAALDMRVVLACRRSDAAQRVVDEIRVGHPRAQLDVVTVDLSDLSSVERCAGELRCRLGWVDVLINNAGGFWSERATTVDGFERHLGVNYLSHYLLTRLLIEGSAGCGRVINVASRGHRAVKAMQWDDLQLERAWRVERAYGQSKLAMILFAKELARRYGAGGLVAHSVLPALSRTNLGRDASLTGSRRFMMWAVGPFLGPAARGAATSIRLATDGVARPGNGTCWAKNGPASVSRAARSDSDARHLWDVSRRLLADAGFDLEDRGTSTTDLAV